MGPTEAGEGRGNFGALQRLKERERVRKRAPEGQLYRVRRQKMIFRLDSIGHLLLCVCECMNIYLYVSRYPPARSGGVGFDKQKAGECWHSPKIIHSSPFAS